MTMMEKKRMLIALLTTLGLMGYIYELLTGGSAATIIIGFALIEAIDCAISAIRGGRQ